MLGAVQLTPCGAHAARGRVTAVDCASGLVAVGQRQGSTLLFSEGNFGAVIELPLNGKLREGASALAFSVSGDVLLLGSSAGALYRLHFSAHGTALEEVPLDIMAQGSPRPTKPAPITAIVRQAGEDIFAIATGRSIYVADASGAVHTKIGPLQETVLQLAWADGSTLIGGTAGAINTWTYNGSQLGPVLRNLSPSPYLLFATSPDSRFLAVVCANKEVQCWELGSVLQSQAMQVAEPIRLADYDSQVDCLEWDPESRFLATSDGPDVTIWDLGECGGEEGADRGCKSSSIACCGHEPKTRVVRMAFQPGGHMLATASNTAKIVLFNVKQFWKGGVVGPATVMQPDLPGEEEITALKWLPGSRLVIGTASGQIRFFEMAAADSSPSATSPRLAPGQQQHAPQQQQAPQQQHTAQRQQQQQQPVPMPVPMPQAVLASPAPAPAPAPVAHTAQPQPQLAAAASPEDAFAQLSLADRQPKAVRVTPATRPAPSPGRGGPPAPYAADSPAYGGATSPRGGRRGEPAGGMYPGYPAGGPMPAAMATSPRQPYPQPFAQQQQQQYFQSPRAPPGAGNNGGGRRWQPQSPGGPFGGGPPPYRTGSMGPEQGPRTPASSRADQGPQQQQQQGPHMQRQASWPAPAARGGGGPFSPQQRGGPYNGGPMQQARGGSAGGGGRNGGGRNGGGGERGGVPGGQPPFGMSSTLMQHIQAVKDNPSGRTDQQGQRRQPQLAGWGAGQPGGMAAGGVPWMMVVPPGGVAPAPGVGPMPMPGATGAMAFPASAAQAQAFAAQQFHAAMMQRMAAAQQQGGQPGGLVPFVPGGAMPTSPRMMAASPTGGPGVLAGPPMAPGMPPTAMMAPPSPHWVPYMQQWGASGSPAAAAYPGGYMAFPAGASPAYMAAAMQAMSAMQQQPMSPTAAAAAAQPQRRQPRNQQQQQQQQQQVAQPVSRGAGRQPGGEQEEGEGETGAFSPLPNTASQSPPPAEEEVCAAERESTHAQGQGQGGGQGGGGGAPRSGSLEQCGSGGVEGALSPTSVARGADAMSVPTPGTSAGDVQSEQSVQRGSLDGPTSPVGRTSPRLALRTSSGSGAGSADASRQSSAAAQLLRRTSSGMEDSGGRRGSRGSAPLGDSACGSPVSPGSSDSVVTVYVGNLPAAVDEYTLGCTFMHFGPVVHVQVIRDKSSLQSKGFGFVTFAHPAYATLAMQQMDQQVLWGPFGGLRIKVAPSKQGAAIQAGGRGFPQ